MLNDQAGHYVGLVLQLMKGEFLFVKMEDQDFPLHESVVREDGLSLALKFRYFRPKKLWLRVAIFLVTVIYNSPSHPQKTCVPVQENCNGRIVFQF